MSPKEKEAFEAAVKAIPEAELRAFVLAWGEGTTSEFRDALVEHAARAVPEWKVPCSDPTLVADAEALVALAKRRDLQPSQIDNMLQRAGRAFVAGDFDNARRAYETVLRSLWNGNISLPGVDEFPDEVLTTSTYDVCARVLVAAYESAPADDRVDSMAAAVELVEQAQQLFMPIRMMEGAAVRPLDDFDAFLPRWLDRLRNAPPDTKEWATSEMIREATLRVEGVDGLARAARASKTVDAYNAWCRVLRSGKHWPELLIAVEEASAASQAPWHVASWQDEAAALKSRLGQRENVRSHLEAAFAAAPTLSRFVRLIDDGSPSGEQLRGPAQHMLREGKVDAPVLVGLLRLLTGEYVEAAQLLVDAPGRGWSSGGHPGDVIFPSLVLLTGGKPPAGSVRAKVCSTIGVVRPESETELPVTPIATLLDRCGAVGKVPGHGVIDALRAAAWKRIEAVTSVTHRSRYAHGALLAVCVAELQDALGDRAGAAAWIERVRLETKWWPRFQAELAVATAITA